MVSEPVPYPSPLSPTRPEASAPAHGASRSTYMWTFVAVVGLLALVAIASAANPVSNPLPAGRADRLELLKLVSAIASGVLVAALTIAIVLHHTIITRRGGEVPLGNTLLRALPTTAATIAVVALMAIARIQLHTGEMPDVVTRIMGSGGRPAMPFGISDDRAPPVIAGAGEADAADTIFVEPRPPAPEPPPYLRILLTTIALALVLAMLSNCWRIRSRRSGLRRHDRVTASDEVAVHGAVVSTIDAMLSDANPNTAIIGAYARLTESLAACGVGRLDHEGPMEHLRRVLTRVHVRPEPLRRLVQLFELARFSTYALTSSHREQALGALHAVAADIARLSPQDAASSRAEAMR